MRLARVLLLAAVQAILVVPRASSAQQTAPLLSAFARTKARALLRDRLPCRGCHVIQQDDGEPATGGRLGPELVHVASRRPPSYIRQIIEDPQAIRPQTIMPKTPMPQAMQDLVIGYLGGSVAAGSGVPRPPVVA